MRSGLLIALCLFVLAAALVESKRASILLSKEEQQRLGVGMTPFGYYPKECLHSVKNHAYIEEHDDGLTIVEADGSRREVEGSCRRAPLPSGWAVYGAWQDTVAVQYFGGAWQVPPDPSDEGTQTVFLFNGLQNNGPVAGPVTIIQPVLQFGESEAGGGKYWSIASWFVSSTGHAVYSELASVSAGHTLLGNMTNNAGLWKIVTFDTVSGVSGTINVRPGAAELFCAVTLEVYSINSCLEFPSGSTTFFDLVIHDNNGPVTPTWTPNAQPGCKEALQVVDSSTVTVKY